MVDMVKIISNLGTKPPLGKWVSGISVKINGVVIGYFGYEAAGVGAIVRTNAIDSLFFHFLSTSPKNG
jgi:hypothetical protein